VKVLLERLIRKFSYEKIQRLIPTEHQKLIANIKKQKDRAQKKKEQLKVRSGGFGQFDTLIN